MEIQNARSPNYWYGNYGRLAIVDHITAGNMPGCLSWLQNPISKASAHYLVTQAGEIYSLVDETNSAWHAGTVNKPTWSLYDGTNPNRLTIGIEHEGWDGELTEAQYQATLWLHRQIIDRWDIPVDTEHIIGHYRIDSVNRANCPGPNFPWERLFKDLKGEDNLQPVKVIVKGKEVPAYIIDGQTFVALRSYEEAKKIEIIWDPTDKVVEVK